MQSIRIAVLALALCFGASLLPVQSHAAAPLPKVKIETSMGDIVVELNPAKAPKTVSNFLYYVKSGFYNNTIFHRVINGFMIQGGGHTADMQEKANSRKPVVNEAGNGLAVGRALLRARSAAARIGADANVGLVVVGHMASLPASMAVHMPGKSGSVLAVVAMSITVTPGTASPMIAPKVAIRWSA